MTRLVAPLSQSGSTEVKNLGKRPPRLVDDSIVELMGFLVSQTTEDANVRREIKYYMSRRQQMPETLTNQLRWPCVPGEEKRVRVFQENLASYQYYAKQGQVEIKPILVPVATSTPRAVPAF